MLQYISALTDLTHHQSAHCVRGGAGAAAPAAFRGSHDSPTESEALRLNNHIISTAMDASMDVETTPAQSNKGTGSRDTGARSPAKAAGAAAALRPHVPCVLPIDATFLPLPRSLPSAHWRR